MKTKILFITSLLLIVGCSKSVEDSTLINKDGLMYLLDSNQPYNGSVFFLKKSFGRITNKERKRYKINDGKDGNWIITKGEYINGKKHGVWIETNKDSTIKKIVNYMDGKEFYNYEFMEEYFSIPKYYVTEDCKWLVRKNIDGKKWVECDGKSGEKGNGSSVTFTNKSGHRMVDLYSFDDDKGFKSTSRGTWNFYSEKNEFRINLTYKEDRDKNNSKIKMISIDKIRFNGKIHYNTEYLTLLGFNSRTRTTPSSKYSSPPSTSTSSNSGCNQSGAKSFAINRINTTIGSTQFLDLHKDNGDSFLFYGSVYSSNYSRDVTVFILIGCSGGSYSVLNVDVQL
jgi:hypothetical protein